MTVIIRLTYDEMSKICYHEKTHKPYNLLWLHIVRSIKDLRQKSFSQRICSIKDYEAFLS